MQARLPPLCSWLRDLGVGSCPASIYEFEKARQLLDFQREWHLDRFPSVSENEETNHLLQEGGRLPIDEIVHWDRWLTAEDWKFSCAFADRSEGK
jgi:hypothetical protein